MKCKACGDDVEELVVVTVNGRATKVCEDCAARLAEQGEVAEAATGKMREMMEYRGTGRK
jgi:ribosome-binding protein aMBF1 (putative translation factor)